VQHDPNLELSVSSSYPTFSNKYLAKKKVMYNIGDAKQSRSSFMSNGSVIEQLKFENYSRHSSIISNKSNGSKSSKIAKLKKDGKMNLMEQKNRFVDRRHTTQDGIAAVNASMPNHLNLGVNMMNSNP
jgi:hypothetical protein